MNGFVFLGNIVLIGIIAWILVERFAPKKLAGFKTWALNVAGAIPLFVDELAASLTEYDFGQFIAADKLPYYVGGLILLNMFARTRTRTAFMGRE